MRLSAYLRPQRYALTTKRHALALLSTLLLSSCFLQEDSIHSGQVGQDSSNPNNNSAPIADAGADQEVYEQSQSELNASASNDPDGTIVSYSWSQVDGNEAIIDDPSAEFTSFTAPAVEDDVLLTFQVTVTDDIGDEAQDTVVVTVLSTDEDEFIVSAGDDQVVYEFSSVQLQAVNIGSHSSDTMVCTWQQIGGTEVSITAEDDMSVSFTAPAVDSPESLTFQVVATDSEGHGHTSEDTVVVTIIKNLPPVADAGADQRVYSQELVELDASASYDPDDDIMSYSWTQIDGGAVSIDKADTPLASFQAPEVTGYVNLVFRLTLVDNQGHQSYDTVVVEVWPNQDPIADAGADQSVSEGDIVYLDASNSRDANNNIASYSWQQLDAASYSVNLSAPNQAQSAFTAPNLDDGDDEVNLTFSVLVTDRSSANASDTVTITVLRADNNSILQADAGANQEVYESQVAVLDASASSHLDGDNLFYSWQQLNTDPYPVNITNSDQAQATFIAPTLSSEDDVNLTFEVSATDSVERSDTSTTVVTVLYNDPPLALASATDQVDEGDQFQLDASASSDAQDSTLTYSWAQIDSSGNVVAADIAQADSAIATFTAPNVDQDTNLSFQVTVTDSLGKSDSTTVAVTVLDGANTAPLASATANPSTVFENQTIELDASASSDPDDGDSIESYSWLFLDSNNSSISADAIVIDQPNSATSSFVAPNVEQDTTLTLQLSVSDTIGAQSDDTVIVTVRANTAAPTAVAAATPELYEGEIGVLEGDASTDPDSNIASYLWSQSEDDTTIAAIDAVTAANTTFIAPIVASDTSITFALTVTDLSGASSSASAAVSILYNNPPAAIARSNPADPIYVNQLVELDATASSDPDGHALTYSWLQLNSSSEDTVSITNASSASAQFTAPAAATNLSFQLTITDELGKSSNDTLILTVLDNSPPQAVATANPNPAFENQTVALDASTSSDPDSGDAISSYSWTYLGSSDDPVAINNANSAAASFIAPEVDTDTNLSFQLTVADSRGQETSTTVAVEILDNTPPTASASHDQSASADQQVYENALVDLSATSTDQDANIASYSWQQLNADPAYQVNITNADQAQASFTAPMLIGGEAEANVTLTFQVTVTDLSNATATAATEVIVHYNPPPEVEAGSDPADTAYETYVVELNASASDLAGGNSNLSYSWQQLNSSSNSVSITNPDQAAATFIAPEITADTTLSFQLIVTDALGKAASDTIAVTILDNAAPQAVASANPNPAYETQVVELDASASIDTDDEIDAYSWLFLDSNGSLDATDIVIDQSDTEIAFFTPPEVDADTSLTFQLTVTDSGGKNSTATLALTVLDNTAPTAIAAATPQELYGGTVGVLDASNSIDSENNIVSYIWSQSSGPSATLASDSSVLINDINGTALSFTAPAVESEAELTFNLTVTDSVGASDSTSASVTVYYNNPPVADAGADTEIYEGEVVVLNAIQSSDSEDSELSYSWIQLDAQDYIVDISDADTAIAALIAPEVTDDTDLTFQVTVTDSGNKTSSDTVIIRVLDNEAPIASAESNESTVYETQSVELDASKSSDPDGTIVDYSWTNLSDLQELTINHANALSPTAWFTIPELDADTNLSFQVTVTDSGGKQSSATVAIEVFDNIAPTAVAVANPDTVFENQNVGLDASDSEDGEDSDGSGGHTLIYLSPNNNSDTADAEGAAANTKRNIGIKSYSWILLEGSHSVEGINITNANAELASFVAPQVDADTNLSFQVTVRDAGGKADVASVSILVLDNTEPVASAVPSASSVYENVHVELDASASSDSEDNIASYSWQQLNPGAYPVEITSPDQAQAAFTAPMLTEDEASVTLTFELTVTDLSDTTDSAQTEVTVLYNPPPIVTASSSPADTVYETQSVDLAANVSDPEGGDGSLSYSWVQLNSSPETAVSIVDSDTANAAFIAPEITAETNLSFQVTVSDSLGKESNATVEIAVLDNIAPEAIAEASPNAVFENQSIELDASNSSDADDSIVSYSWTYLGNSAADPAISVAIVNPDQPQATVIAPQVDANTSLSFQVTVADSRGKQDSATVEVEIFDNTSAPIVRVDSSQQVYENASVNLDASASTDPDKNIASYSWRQLNAESESTDAVTISNADQAQAAFVAPALSSEETLDLTFEIEITDLSGASETNTTVVSILYNRPPVALLSSSHSSLYEGETLILDASSSYDREGGGNIVSYAWQQLNGRSGGIDGVTTSPAITFAAPQVDVDRYISFAVTVADDFGKDSTDEVLVRVFNNNPPDVELESEDSNISAGAIASLDASVSDDTGTRVEYSWVELSTFGVSIERADTANAHIVIPEDLPLDSKLSFQFTATDSLGAQSDPETLALSIVAEGTIKWTYPPEGDSSTIGKITSPVIGNTGRIFFGDDDGYFYAFEPDGSLAWFVRVKTPQKDITASPSILADKNRVIFSDDRGDLHVVHENYDVNGEWRTYSTGTGAPLSSVAVGYEDDTAYYRRGTRAYERGILSIPLAFTSPAQETSYVVLWQEGYDGSGHDFDLLWTSTPYDDLEPSNSYGASGGNFSAPIIAQPEGTSTTASRSKLASNSRVFYGSNSYADAYGYLYYTDVGYKNGSIYYPEPPYERTEAEMGYYDLSSYGYDAGIDTPMITTFGNPNPQFATNGKYAVEFDRASGQFAHYRTGGVYIFTTPPVVDSADTMYLGIDYVGNVVNAATQYAIRALNPADEDTGKRTYKWDYSIPSQTNISSESLTIGADGVLYFGTEDGADVNGNAHNGALHALNLSDASSRWSLTLIDANDQITSSPVISADGTIYFGTERGRFYAVHSSSAGVDVGSKYAWPRYGYDNRSMAKLGWHRPTVSIDVNISEDFLVDITEKYSGNDIYDALVGATVQLDAGINSYDVDGEIVDYYWQEVDEEGNSSSSSLYGITFSNNTGATTSFQIPEDLITDGTIRIRVTATDNAHFTKTSTQTINFIVP